MSNTSVLTVEIHPCYALKFTLASLHVGASVVAFVVLGWWGLLCLLPLIYSLRYQLKQANRRHRLTLFPDLSGVVRLGEDPAVSGNISVDSYISSYLILFSFNPLNSRQLSIPIFPGSLTSSEFQALISYLNTHKSAYKT